MILADSSVILKWFSLILTDSCWFSLILDASQVILKQFLLILEWMNDSEWFSAIFLTDSQVILADFQWFSNDSRMILSDSWMIPSDSHWFLNDCQLILWFLVILEWFPNNSHWFSNDSHDSWWFSLILVILRWLSLILNDSHNSHLFSSDS